MLTSTHLYREIFEQPEVINRMLASAVEPVHELVEAIRSRDISQVIVAARGTSDNAGIYAKYILGAINRLPVGLAAPSLYTIYQSPPHLKNAMILGISQSGKSPDIVSVVNEARQQGALTAVITNAPGSDLANEAEFVIDLKAGEEKAVAATKTYTAELACVALISAALSGDAKLLADLRQIPGDLSATLKMEELISSVASRYRYMSSCIVIGRGYNYATAFELALKLKELTYSVVQPYSSADFLHGPMALIDEGFPVIVIAPSGLMQGQMAEFVSALNENAAEVIAISDVEGILNQSRIPLTLPRTVPEWLSPLTAIIPGQLLSLHLANERGFDVDAPRRLSKVTETR